MRKSFRGSLWLWTVLIALAGMAALVAAAWWRSSETSRVPEPATPIAQVTEAGNPQSTMTAPVSTELPPATVTVEPTETLELTPEDEPLPVEQTPEPMLYRLHSGTPVYTRAFAHSAEGCTWLGVAGQVFQKDGSAASEVAILVTGIVNGAWLERAVIVEAGSVYGPGGYEIQLAQRLPAATTSFIIQLFDLNSQPLSDPVAVRVPDNCEENLALVNFQAGNTGSRRFFLPVANAMIEP